MNKKFKPFLFEDVFYIKDGYYNKKPPAVNNNDKDSIPFIGATQNNNGITGFVKKDDVIKYDKVGNISNKDISKRIYKGGCIAVTNNGSVGNAYFQNSEFTCSHDVTILYGINKEINKEVAMFLIAMIKYAGMKYTYANKWRPIRMRKSIIMLPITDSGEPDFDWMELYIKAKYNPTLKKINLFKKHDIQLSTDTKWSVFTIDDIADIYGGKDWSKLERSSGKTPFIGSSSLNNGVTDYVTIKNKKHVSKNAISINRNGSVGYAFYHPYEAYFSGDTRYIILKEHSNNQYINSFITVMITAQKDKYTFGYKLGTDRIKRQKILLPINEDGTINYVYMENYIKHVQNNLIEKLSLIK
ncbi:restriction endonuclease subunit S [Macrococcoides caseolyticum]|uniref:restriction endonuclease subunit S n=1 Tax=Macrococcoides caseolyticum TaxID=69966 RepID=UPI0024BCA05A|nr:restriction endonuclease subunit S [Macrococcus caseolyticus]MDJ1089830.1 restriction endonuclease subunit S [Macrococcus caseolyticus]